MIICDFFDDSDTPPLRRPAFGMHAQKLCFFLFSRYQGLNCSRAAWQPVPKQSFGTSKWHKRNIRIFANLARIAEPGDRIIVIFGSGHSPLLRYFVESHAQMKLVEPNDYL